MATGGTLDVSSTSATSAKTQFFVSIVSNRAAFRRLYGGAWQAWQEIYHTGNLLGTVSQSAGVPTGGIIEAGSNANGSYTRFADGTLILTREGTIDGTVVGSTSFTFPVNSVNNGLFSSLATDQIRAISIGTTATAGAQVIKDSIVGAEGTASSGGYGANRWHVRVVVANASASSVPVNLTAIGRWF